MVEHSASVTVKAPVHQVYELFAHFNDFPKFMSFVKEVTYYDEQRSHWVAQVIKQYEWDAVNEDWIPDQQIGWRSTGGLNNTGKVKFRALGPMRTEVDVYIRYIPPTGPLGEIGETLGISSYFDSVLQKDLNHFARMVEQAPPGALDPMSSHYLFHDDSATRKGKITSRQKVAMANDPMMSPEALADRQTRIAQEEEIRRRTQEEHAAERQLKAEQALQKQQAWLELKARLDQEAQKRREEQKAHEAARLSNVPRHNEFIVDPREARYVYAWLAHVLGDRDGTRARVPNFAQDPMTSRSPGKVEVTAPSPPMDSPN